MMRNILSVVVSAIVWMAGFLALGSLAAFSWPDYRVHARAWTQDEVFTFTSPMASLTLLFWVIAAIAGGWVARKIATRREAVWVLAGILEIYVLALHVVLYWPKFPWWYNLGVIIPCVPAIFVGAKLAGAPSPASKVAAG
jgi:hypothetical protein